MVPVRRGRPCGRRRPARHVPHAVLRPGRVPAGDRGRLRGRPHAGRDRVVLHPHPRRRREVPRLAHGARCLPRPAGHLRGLLPSDPEMADEPMVRVGVLHSQLGGRRPPFHLAAPRRGLLRVRDVRGPDPCDVEPAARRVDLRRRPRPHPDRRRRGISGGIQPLPTAVPRRLGPRRPRDRAGVLRPGEPRRPEGTARVRVDPGDVRERPSSTSSRRT